MRKRILATCLIFAMTLTLIPPGTVSAAVKLNKKSITIVKGKTYKLKLKGAKKKVKWSSKKKKIAKVSSSGKVTAKKAGKTIVTAKIGKKSYKCNVKVVTAKLNKTKMELNTGTKYRLKITGTGKVSKWKSSNTSVATISKKGEVTAKSAGSAVITAKIGVSSLKCNVTVKAVKKTPVDSKKKKQTDTGDSDKKDTSKTDRKSDTSGKTDAQDKSDSSKTSDKTNTSGKTDNADKPETTDKPGATDSHETTDKPGATDKPSTTNPETRETEETQESLPNTKMEILEEAEKQSKIVEQKKKAMDDAYDPYVEADDAVYQEGINLDEAKFNLQTAEENVETAKGLYETNLAKYNNIKSNLQPYEDGLKEAQANLPVAEQSLKEKETALATAKENEKTAVEASASLKNTFLEKEAIYEEELKKYQEFCKGKSFTDTNKGLYGFCLWLKENKPEYADEMNDLALPLFDLPNVKDCTHLGEKGDGTSLEQVLLSAEGVNTLNYLREKEGVAPVKTSVEIMVDAALAANTTRCDTYYHDASDLLLACTAWNLAGDYFTQSGYGLWYLEEKRNVEEGRDGYVGHYYHIVDPRHKVAGMGMCTNALNSADMTASTLSMFPGHPSEVQMTPDEFRELLLEYIRTLPGDTEVLTEIVPAQKAYAQFDLHRGLYYESAEYEKESEAIRLSAEASYQYNHAKTEYDNVKEIIDTYPAIIESGKKDLDAIDLDILNRYTKIRDDQKAEVTAIQGRYTQAQKNLETTKAAYEKAKAEWQAASKRLEELEALLG